VTGPRAQGRPGSGSRSTAQRRAKTPRLVFGESLSPDDIRRVRRCTVEGVCAMPQWAWPGPRPEDCGGCRARHLCGVRRDDAAAAKEAVKSAERAVARACRAADPCPDWIRHGGCDHHDAAADEDDPGSMTAVGAMEVLLRYRLRAARLLSAAEGAGGDAVRLARLHSLAARLLRRGCLSVPEALRDDPTVAGVWDTDQELTIWLLECTEQFVLLAGPAEGHA